MTAKPGRGGARKGAGRPPKGDEPREQRSINLTPRVWAFIAYQQLALGGSDSDIIERLIRSHILFPSD